jgi:hypothetical protein
VLHMILVALACSVAGAIILDGVVYLLLKIFAPHAFLETAVDKTAAPQAQTANITDLIFGETRISTKRAHITDLHLLTNRGWFVRVKIHSAIDSLNPAGQVFLLGQHEESDDIEQLEQTSPRQRTAKSMVDVVQ